MKVFTLFIIFCFLFLNSACQNQTVLSQQSENTQKLNTPQNSNQSNEALANDDESLDIDKLVVDTESLAFDEYKISKVITKKKDDEGSPEADIQDAILEKNGKKILKFEGVYYPSGNQMQFGLFSLTKSKNKELLVYDNSNRFGRFWIVNFDNQANQIFDSGDWNGFREFIDFNDFENDGIYEFTMVQYNYLGFEFLASIDTPLMSIIFKYDQKSEKYLPANFKYQETAKEIIDKQDQDDIKNNLTFRPMLENFLELIYAGMEKEAWEYFEKNYKFSENYRSGIADSNSNVGRSEKGNLSEISKQKLRKQIENSLEKDKVYQFIKTQLKNNN